MKNKALLLIGLYFLSVCAMELHALEGKDLLTDESRVKDLVKRKNKLAFTMDVGNNYEIFVMNTDGNNLTRVTFDVYSDDGDPKWIDDKTIAYIKYKGCRGEGINRTYHSSKYYKINIDGTNEKEISWEFYDSIDE